MSRNSGKPATLQELMGKFGSDSITVKDLPLVLGEKMPEMNFDRVGEFRLKRALRNRFGEGWRNLPGIKSLLSDFDRELKVNTLIKLNKRRR